MNWAGYGYMTMPHHGREYAEQADMDWALQKFHEALKARAFAGTKRGKRGWQDFPQAMERMQEELQEWKEATTNDERGKELLDAALFLFMEWWRT